MSFCGKRDQDELDELTAMFANLLKNGLITRDDLVTQGHADVASVIMNSAPPVAEDELATIAAGTRKRRSPRRSRRSDEDSSLNSDEDLSRESPSPRRAEGMRNNTITRREPSSAFHFDDGDVTRSASIAAALTAADTACSEPAGLSSERDELLIMEG